MTRFFLDTEFCEDGRTIDLLSIGVVAEDGREFYRQNAGADLHKANAWVKENVLPKLLPCPKGLMQVAHRGSKCGHPECSWRPTYMIGRELVEWVHDRVLDQAIAAEGVALSYAPKPEFWGYYANYDWVAVCQLFGRMVDLPPGWPMYCRDLKQWCDDLGNPKLPDEGKGEHNALYDAQWNRLAWVFLDNLRYYQRMQEAEDARQGNQQEISARQIGEEPKHIRSPKTRRARQVVGSGDQ